MAHETTITGQTHLRLADDVTCQSLGPGEDTVMLSLASGYLYTCNETAARFVAALDGRRTIADIAADMEREFDAAPAQLQADLLLLAEELTREKLVVVV